MGRSKLVLAVVAIAVASSAAASLLGRHFLWNGTPSSPRGLYCLSSLPRALPLGALVAFSLPPQIAELVRERNYLPVGPRLRLLKRVVGLPGTHVCCNPKLCEVAGLKLPVLELDAQGRPLPRLALCRTLSNEEYFLASEVQGSFDSRYIGPVRRQEMAGVATPVWLF